jgi:hypothetical protein
MGSYTGNQFMGMEEAYCRGVEEAHEASFTEEIEDEGGERGNITFKYRWRRIGDTSFGGGWEHAEWTETDATLAEAKAYFAGYMEGYVYEITGRREEYSYE